jgi:cysteine desulfuration protein SufE
MAFDPHGLFGAIGLADHLTPQRSNGLASMVKRIKSDASAALTGVN